MAEPPEAMVAVTIATFKFPPNLKPNRLRKDNEKAKLLFISQKEYILLNTAALFMLNYRQNLSLQSYSRGPLHNLKFSGKFPNLNLKIFLPLNFSSIITEV